MLIDKLVRTNCRALYVHMPIEDIVIFATERCKCYFRISRECTHM